MHHLRISYWTLVHITKILLIIFYITLSTVYEIYVSFRKIKDQGTEMGMIMVLT